MAILIGTTKDGSSTDGRTLFPDGRNQEIHHLEKDHQTRSYSPPKTIFVVSLQGTPGAHDSNNGRLDLFKEKWRNACGSSSAFTHIEHCAAPLDSRRGYGVTWAWILCVWRARQLNEEAVIFLEDDARLFENSTDDFCDVKRRGQLLSKLPDDTFLAFLGGHTWFYKDTKVPFRQVRHSYGAYGFVVPRESIDDFYEALSSGLLQGRNKALNPEDIFYSAARRCHKSIYAFNPLIVWHEGGYSNTWGRVRGNITGLESHKQGINTSSGRKRLVTKIATRPEIADQEQEMNYLHKPSTFGAGAAKCTFCEGKEMSDGDLIVPDTGGKTCISIKAMAAGEVDGSEICAIMQKEETVCCPEEPPAQFANSIPMNSPPAANGSSRQRERGKRQKKSGNHGIVWAIKPSKDHDYVQGYVAEIKPASLCACAKCGSTAFWEELFAIVQGKSFQSMNYTGPSTIHNLLSKRIWTNIQAERRTDWLDFEDHDSFALIRDPKERIISAWKDKVSCEHAHVQTKFFVHGLLKLAGSGNNITARVSKNGGFPCLDLSEYLELMSQIHALGKEGFLEEHFLPQNLGCFKDAPPSIWTHVTTVSDPNGRCSLESVVLKSANMSKTGEECLLLKRHVTRMKQSLKPTRADEAILDAITRNEYEMLGQYLPKVSDTTNDDKAVPVATLERVGSKDEGGEHEAVVPPITNIATRPIADQEHELNHPDATKCTFCEGKEMPNGDLIVPDTGEKTCSSIKAMAAGEVNGNEICAIMQKEETVCCPVHHTKAASLSPYQHSLLVRTGTFSNCSQTMETRHAIVGKASSNDQNATVSCRTLRFSAEKSSFVGRSGAVIVGVLSAPENFDMRESIRTTWAANNAAVFFLLAGPWNDIKEEYYMYKDIIWIDMDESYRLITYKTLMFLQVVNMMASELNLSYSHVLKTDDDSYVALGWLNQFVKKEEPKYLDYWGYCQKSFVKPLRNPKSRYYESLDQYPWPFYPPFVRGAGILLSRKTLECVARTMQDARFLDLEDVFIGILAGRCGTEPTHSDLVRVYANRVVTMKEKIIQHRISSKEEMIAHHNSVNTEKFRFDTHRMHSEG